jgi:hypothetical protein
MSIGLGIFLSSLVFALVLLYGITRERWNWRRITRSVFVSTLILGGLIIFVAGGIYVWKHFAATKLKRTEYAGLRLRMTRNEIKYVKGTPSHVLDGVAIPTGTLTADKKIEDFDEWAYDDGLVLLFKQDLLAVISCQSRRHIFCPDIDGITNGDNEEKLLSVFGEPSNASIEEFVKIMEYSNIGMILKLRERKIVEIMLYDTTVVKPTGH